eukprot:Colp12_sorted_trinity150504_noHs@11057
MLGIITTVTRGARRGVMISKRGNKNFYKGRGAEPTGRHTRKGGYKIEGFRIPKIVVPDLTNCQLRPYVSWNAPKDMASQPLPVSIYAQMVLDAKASRADELGRRLSNNRAADRSKEK